MKRRSQEAPPLEGEGLGWGGLAGNALVGTDSTPIQPSPLKGEGFGRKVRDL
jgi:hypothetical protein